MHGQLSEEPRLQKAITGLMDESALAEMKKTLTRPELQRITSAGAKYAGTWLTVILSTYDGHMADQHSFNL